MLIWAGFLVLLGLCTAVLSWSSRYLRYCVRRLATNIGDTVPAGIQSLLEDRAARRARGVGLGVVAAGIAILAVVLVWGPDVVDADGLWAVVALTFTFGALGLAAVEIWWPVTVEDSAVRTARTSVPVLADYLSPSVMVLTWSLTVLSWLVLAGALVLGRTKWFDEAVILGGPVPIFGVGVTSLAILTVLAVRRVLNAPQPASDQRELFWQDALRASTLSSLYTALTVSSLLGLMLASYAVDDAASVVALSSGQVGPEWTGSILMIAYTLAPIYLVVNMGLTLSGQGRRDVRHFCRRLWTGDGGQRRASA